MVFAPAISNLSFGSGLGYLLNLAFWPIVALPLLKAAQLSVEGGARVRRESIEGSRGAIALGGVFVLIQIVALLRGMWSDNAAVAGASYRMTVCTAMIIAVMVAWHGLSLRSSKLPSFFTAAVVSLGAYCAANFLLFALGVRSPNADIGTATEPSYLLSLVGIHQTRTLFPMAWGVNNFGIIAGAVLTMGICRYWMAKSHRGFTLVFLIIIPFICCILSDSRAAITFGVAAAVLALRAPRMGTGGIFLFWLLAAIAILSTQALQTVTLGGRDGQGTFTGREIMWAAGVAELSQFKLQHLWGYGNFGQMFSGVSAVYEFLFKMYSDSPELISVHNAYLQIILDCGYLGLIALSAFLWSSIRALGREAHSSVSWEATAGLALLLFLSTNGLTEVTLSLNQPWAALLLFSAIALLLHRPRIKVRPF